ncbi:TspO/MBR family protein [Novosphingobium sp. PASSN1]|uniref:TspO/MBR family protein n=1 Tax=Novosphingobium sp. PASSN1 TaxID=2015561 RepID=UPI0025DADDEF|nr:TspO/MBR family protein [Novosphingobium sp. PASSN1]
MAAPNLRTSFLRAEGRGALAMNVTVLIVATIAINGFLFAIGWARPSGRQMPMIPPGAVVGLIWTVLLGLMGAARWVYVRGNGDAGWRSWTPFALAALCIAYPFYTSGLQRNDAAFWGTVVTLIVAVAVMLVLRGREPRAPWLIVPTAFWGGYVLSVMIAYPPA